MCFPEGRKNNPTAGCEEKGSLTRGNNITPVKGNWQGWWLPPSQWNAWATFCGYIRQRKRIQIRLNPKSWKSSPRGFQMGSESVMDALCWQGRGLWDTCYGHEWECCPHSVTIPTCPPAQDIHFAPAARGLRAHGCFHAGHSLQINKTGRTLHLRRDIHVSVQGLLLS